MAGDNVFGLSQSLDLNFQGSGRVWENHQKKRGWNKSPTTYFVALVLRIFSQLALAIPAERSGEFQVNPFCTKNLAAHLGQHYTRRGSPVNPAVVFYTLSSAQRHHRIALHVRVVPIFGNMLINTPANEPINATVRRNTNKGRKMGMDGFNLLFATVEENKPRSIGGTAHGGERVNLLEILLLRLAWKKFAELAHEEEKSTMTLPRGFFETISKEYVSHQDALTHFFDSFLKFSDKWKSMRNKKQIKIETICGSAFSVWGQGNNLSASFCALMNTAVNPSEWEAYRIRLTSQDLYDNGTKISIPSIGVLQEGIMGDSTMTHGERMKLFGQTGRITHELFDFLVKLRSEWVRLRNDYYTTEDVEIKATVRDSLMKLIKEHSPVAGEWTVNKVVNQMLERKAMSK